MALESVVASSVDGRRKKEGDKLKNPVCAIVGAVALAACGGDSSRIDPNLQWRLSISTASLLATNNGALWDGDASAPDVYVRLTADGLFVDSTTVQDSYTPEWNPADGIIVTTAVLLGAGVAPVTAQFFDADVLVDDSVTDQLPLVFTEDEILAGGVTFGGTGGLASATFLITPY